MTHIVTRPYRPSSQRRGKKPPNATLLSPEQEQTHVARLATRKIKYLAPQGGIQRGLLIRASEHKAPSLHPEGSLASQDLADC